MDDMNIVRASTRDLGARLLALADEVEDWSTADHPEAAAIIQELRSRDTEMAREWLARVAAWQAASDALDAEVID